MRLFPAHLRDAKQMARDLFDAFSLLGIVLDQHDEASRPPSLQQCQEIMANAMGYAGWRELSKLVKEPHSSVYLDGLSEEHKYNVLDQLLSRMVIQFNHFHSPAALENAVLMSGVGFCPATRRELAVKSSPWGPIEDEEIIADGIRRVSTSNHGGWLLSPERQAKVPQHLLNQGGAYEEDGEYKLVALAFPDECVSFGVTLADALAYLEIVDFEECGSKRTFEVGTIEREVVDYLAQCVRLNKLPIRLPREDEANYSHPLIHSYTTIYSLSEWAELYARLPRIDGRWAMRPEPWFEHCSFPVMHRVGVEATQLAWHEDMARQPTDSPS